ncbi:hypothetical protein EDC94DRAFT_616807, partial [Helicostylum pulchrum]
RTRWKSEKLETFKTIINKHRETFLERTSYKPIDLKYGQQIANYEVTKIRTAYINNVTSNFGNKLRKIRIGYRRLASPKKIDGTFTAK